MADEPIIGVCPFCGDEDVQLTRHHLVPRKLGGDDDDYNIILLCRPCHEVIHQHGDDFDERRLADERLNTLTKFIKVLEWLDH